jgi:hypothetical protein
MVTVHPEVTPLSGARDTIWSYSLPVGFFKLHSVAAGNLLQIVLAILFVSIS